MVDGDVGELVVVLIPVPFIIDGVAPHSAITSDSIVRFDKAVALSSTMSLMALNISFEVALPVVVVVLAVMEVVTVVEVEVVVVDVLVLLVVLVLLNVVDVGAIKVVDVVVMVTKGTHPDRVVSGLQPKDAERSQSGIAMPTWKAAHVQALRLLT